MSRNLNHDLEDDESNVSILNEHNNNNSTNNKNLVKDVGREEIDQRSMSIESLNDPEANNNDENDSNSFGSRFKQLVRFEKIKRFSKEQLLVPKILYLLMFLSIGSLMPYIPLILKSKNLTISEIGIFLSIDRLSRVFANPIFGLLADKTQRHKSIMLLNMIFSNSMFLIVVLLDWDALPWLAYPLFLIASFSRTPVTTLLDHMTLELLGKNKELYGKQRIFGGIAWGIVAIVVGSMVEVFGINATAFCAIIFAIPFVISAFFMLPNHKDHFESETKLPNQPSSSALLNDADSKIPRSDTQSSIHSNHSSETQHKQSQSSSSISSQANVKTSFLRGFWTLITNKQMFMFLVVCTFNGLVGMIVSSYASLYVTTVLGGSSSWVGYAMFTSVLTECSFFFFSAKIVEKVGYKWLVVSSHVAFVVRLAGYCIITEPYLLLIVELTHGLTFAAFWTSAIQVAPQLAEKRLAATAQSLWQGCYNGVGSGLGSLIGGLIFEKFGPVTLFLSTCGVISFSGILFFFSYKTPKPQDSEIMEVALKTIATTETEKETEIKKKTNMNENNDEKHEEEEDVYMHELEDQQLTKLQEKLRETNKQ